MLDLATLKATLQPIRAVGEVEERFMIENIEVCMRVLNPKEEIEVQRWAQQVVLNATPEQQDRDNSIAVEYLNRFKLGCLSYALVEINGLDLRNQDFVATGETLANGKPVKVKKTEAMIEILEAWPRPLLSSVFKKFNEIMERCEIQSDKSIEFNPPDIDSEISQLLQRLQTLEEMKKGKENADVVAGNLPKYADESPPAEVIDPPAKNTTNLANASTDTAPVSTNTAPNPPSNTGVRKSAIPTTASPMEPVVEQPEEPEEAVEVTHNEVQTASGSTGTLASQGGWIDPKGDSDAMESAMHAETLRIQEMRAKRNANTNTTTHEQPEATSANPRFVPPKNR